MTENSEHPDLTAEEQELVQRSALSAIALVSRADPGFFDTFRESLAASQTFAMNPAGAQILLRGGLPSPPPGPIDELEGTTLADLSQAARILDAKDPEQAQAFREVVLEAADRAAMADGERAPEEEQIIARIREALTGAAESDAQDPTR